MLKFDIAMHKDVETLLEVQALEQRLKELDSEINSLPRRLAAIEAQIASQKSALESAQAAQAATQAERRKLESQVQDLKAKVEKSRGHSGEVKNNQEYKALLDEIAFGEAEVAKSEERLLQLMEDGEARAAAVKEAEQALAAAQATIAGEKRAIEERAAADRAERQRVAEQRAGRRATVAEDTLRRYDRVARLRGQAVAMLDQNACGCCRVRLRPQFLQEILAPSDRVFFCESCGRLLYAATAGAEPEVAPVAGAAQLA